MKPLVTREDFLNTYRQKKSGEKAIAIYHHLFPLYPSHLLAGLVADLLTDGHLQVRRQYKHSLHYSLINFCSKDDKEISFFDRRLYTLFRVRGKLYSHSRVGYKCSSKMYFLSHSTIVRLLNLAGVVSGNKTLAHYEVPSWIMNGSDSIKKSFLRRSFTCEGYIGPKDKKRTSWHIRYWMYKTASLSWSAEEYLNSLKSLLLDFGIRASMVYLDESYVRKSDSLTMYGLSFSICDKASILKFRNSIGFDLDYKQSRLEEATQT